MARLRSAPSADANIATQRSTRQALKEKTNNVRPKRTIYEYQENIEELVKPARPRRRPAKQTSHDENELVMAGGLGKADEDAPSQEHRDSPTSTDELPTSDGTAIPNAKRNRRPARAMRKAVQTEAKSNALDDLKKRMLQSNEPVMESSPSIEPEATASSASKRLQTSTRYSQAGSRRRSASPEDRRSPSAQPHSALKATNTPAVETSILALKNFKRRPRQPSMLQMVQQRTASARPSLVNTSTMQDASGYELEDVDDFDDFDEDEFAPDAVGTPFNVKKAVPPPQSNSTGKRKRAATDLASPALGVLSSKRLRSMEADLAEGIRIAQTQSRQGSSEPRCTLQSTAPADVQVINSSPFSELPLDPLALVRDSFTENEHVVPSTEPAQGRRTRSKANEPDDPNDTMAEPLSSSPQPSDQIIMSTADIMADPLTQVSPPRRRDRAKKENVKPMTTAKLQSLLPKRRTRRQPGPRKSEYDLDSESENEDQQDGSDVDNRSGEESGTRHCRRTKSKPQAKKKTTATKSRSRPSKASTRKSKTPASAPSNRASRAPTAATKSGQTYTRTRAGTATSDKENVNDAAETSAFEDLPEDDPSALPDTSISMIEAAQSAELEAARKKFADIDDWEMEFESMSVEEGRSSSQEWR